AQVAEAGMHLAGDRAAVGARYTVGGNELGVGLQLVDVFRDRERVPDLDAVMGEAGDEKRRRQQKEFGPRGWVVARRLWLVELETGHFAKQPTAQRPGGVILAGDGERGHGLVPRGRPEKLSRTAT